MPIRSWFYAGVAGLLLATGCSDDVGSDAGPEDSSTPMDSAMPMDSSTPDSVVLDTMPDADTGAPLVQTCEADSDLGMATGESVAVGSTVDGDDDVTPECVSSSRGAPDTMFSWQAPTAGTWTIDTFGSAFDTILHVRDASCALLACADDTAHTSRLSRVDVELDAGDMIFIVVDGAAGGRGDFQLNITQPPATETNCVDGVDDDRDSQTDCTDPDCAGQPSCIELVCDDGLDNDMDFFFDCDDSDCVGIAPCAEVDCTNGLDDDMDGTADCADDDCSRVEPCTELTCDDGLDNDMDGDTDCADSACRCDAACVAPRACPGEDLGMRLGTALARGRLIATECSLHEVSTCTGPGPVSGIDLRFGRNTEHTFGWTAPSSGDFTFDTVGSDFDTVLYVLPSSCTGDALACNDDIAVGTFTASRFTLSLSAGQTVTVVVDGGNNVGNYVLSITPD